MAKNRKAGQPQPGVNLVTMAQNHGGFSVKEDSGNFGPKGTYASWAGTEDVVEGTLTSNRVRQFRTQNAEALARPGAYFGGYREPEGIRQRSPQREGDTTYLDVSRRFTGSDRLNRATDFARKQGQVSVFDTESGLGYVHTNEAVPEESKYEYSANMANATRAQIEARKARAGDRSAHIESMVDAIFAAQNLKR